ncbi:MAG: hypothetical protein ACOXZW_03260 [Bacilli bacterium]|jgi:anti-anti-sigma regulatory factor|nr:hypothetical protein [Bacilli bacterium]
MKVEMEYTKETLIINLSGILDETTLTDLKRKVFTIIDEYKIENIILNGKNLTLINQPLLTAFLESYQDKYDGKLIIKT